MHQLRTDMLQTLQLLVEAHMVVNCEAQSMDDDFVQMDFVTYNNNNQENQQFRWKTHLMSALWLALWKPKQ